MATVYSFDLFDTVISRKTGTPKGIFCMMQQKMQETWPNRMICLVALLLM